MIAKDVDIPTMSQRHGVDFCINAKYGARSVSTRGNSQCLILYGIQLFKAVWRADEYTMEPQSKIDRMWFEIWHRE